MFYMNTNQLPEATRTMAPLIGICCRGSPVLLEKVEFGDD